MLQGILLHAPFARCVIAKRTVIWSVITLTPSVGQWRICKRRNGSGPSARAAPYPPACRRASSPPRKRRIIFATKWRQLFGHLSGRLSRRRAVYRKSNFSARPAGQNKFCQKVNHRRTPAFCEKGWRLLPFDSEGARTERRDIVKDGVLTQWLLTNYSARKLGLKSNGHAGGIHNWRIAGQGLNFWSNCCARCTGPVVTELMGCAAGITGDYSAALRDFVEMVKSSTRK